MNLHATSAVVVGLYLAVSLAMSLKLRDRVVGRPIGLSALQFLFLLFAVVRQTWAAFWWALAGIILLSAVPVRKTR